MTLETLAESTVNKFAPVSSISGTASETTHVLVTGVEMYIGRWQVAKLYDDVDEDRADLALRRATRRALRADDYETTL
jgi:hypothetical protein